MSPKPNPYTAPAFSSGEPRASAVALTRADVDALRDFRTQSVALGAAWSIFGVLAVVLGVLMTYGVFDDGPNTGQELGIVTCLVSIAWFAAGVGTLLKKRWSVYLGLTLSYIGIFGNAIRLNICLVVILVVVVIQAHRVLKFIRILEARDIPLDTLPPS